MKQLLRHSINLLLVIGIATMFIGCEKGPNFHIVQYPAQTVTGFGPASGYPGIYATITGKNFGTLKGAVKVWFGGVKADSVISVTDGQIVVKVPALAVTGKVTLQVWTHTNDSIGKYTVLAIPVIKSVTSAGPLGTGIAAAGDVVVIKGTGFGTDLSKIGVSFNGTIATTITSVTDTSIQVKAPTGYLSGNIIVSVNGFPITGSPLLNPDVKGDISVFYLKNYQQTFTSTVVSGTGRWRIPTDWTVTSPMLNHGGYGGWDSDDGTVLAVESGWGAPAIVNGKMYETFTLPAGNYTFTADLYKNGFNNPVYIVAAAGSTLPDATLVPTASLGYFSMVSTHLDVGAYDTYPSFNFALTQPTQISIGFVVTNMTDGGEFWRVKNVKLVSN
jgi:hypothetical protein